jgi:putative hydrolase of the HAD superfamily
LIRAALFDAAGTLLEPREPVGEVYARRAREHGVDLSARRVGDAFRQILAGAEPMVFPDAAPPEIPALEREWWRRVVRSTFLAADSGARFDDFEGCFDRLWRHFADPAAWAPRPGGHELLARLNERGLRLAVVSNFDHRLPTLLAGLDLATHLDAVILPWEARAAKPDPRIFGLALERLGVSPAEAVFLGDDAARDLAGARGAGIRAVDVGSLATLAGFRVPDEGGK